MMARCVKRRMTAGVIGSMVALSSARAESVVERGRYLVTIMDCGGCHTTGALRGQPMPGHTMAGSDIGWAVPGIGVVTPPNLTPDPTGLADWSASDIVKLLRTGVRPDGREIAGPMAWRAYAQLSEADMQAVVAYLKSLPPVAHAVPGPTVPEAMKGPYFTVAMPH